MKKRQMLMMAACASALLWGCSGNGGSGTTETMEKADAGANAGTEKVTVKVMQFKTEISDQMNEMAADYMKEHPDVDLQIESVISDEYETVLKTRFASGEAPDIFNNEGHQKMAIWLENMEDLSDQPWVADMIPDTKEGISTDGAVYGLPLYLESYSFLYNKDLFEQAGITETPTTLTGLREVMEKLKAAGISVLAVNGSEWYPNGTFLANIPAALQEDPNDFIKQLNEGTATIPENPLYQDWTNLVELMREYAYPDPMSIDFSGVVTEFASGNVAMILGVNGYQTMIDEINPDFNLGMMPMPVNDDSALNDRIFASASTYWCVNKNSSDQSKEAAKEFLNWLVTSETGKKYITEDFQFIPGLASIEINEEAVGQTGTETERYIEDGKISGWQWMKYPDGTTVEFGSIIQKYYAGEIGKEEMLTEFQEAWDNLKEN